MTIIIVLWCIRFFARGSLLDAIECYTTALKLCPTEEEYAYNRVSFENSLLFIAVGK